MPRTPEQNEDIRQQRSGEILRAAVQVYLEKGVHGSDIAQIAERAGVTRGLVYHYYHDKMSLFRALFEEYVTNANMFVEQTLNTEEPPLLRLRRYVEHFLRSAVDQPQMVQFYRNLYNDAKQVFGDESEAFLRRLDHDMFGPLVRTVEEAMDRGEIRRIEPRFVSMVFWGAVMGAMNMLTMDPDKERYEERLMSAITLVFDGLVNGEKRGDNE